MKQSMSRAQFWPHEERALRRVTRERSVLTLTSATTRGRSGLARTEVGERDERARHRRKSYQKESK